MPDLVVDIGNTRIKWGRCSDQSIDPVVSLPADNEAAWSEQWQRWRAFFPNRSSCLWGIASVHPARCDVFVRWLQQQNQQVQVLEHFSQLPIIVEVDYPDRVGIDRLLNAVAANRRKKMGRSAIIIDAGTAITVDWMDAHNRFGGGFILPGLRLMGRSLNDHTAKLPLITNWDLSQTMPPKNTETAIREGIFWTLVGGIDQLRQRLVTQLAPQMEIDEFLTGGDGNLFFGRLRSFNGSYCSTLTLEGIQIALESYESNNLHQRSNPKG